VWSWARGAPQNFGVPYNIYSTGEASNFKIGMHRRKSGRGPGLEERLKILGSPFNICATAEASNFKFGMLLGFAKAHHKTKLRGTSSSAMAERPREA